MKYQFIAEQQQDYPIKTMCRVLERCTKELSYAILQA